MSRHRSYDARLRELEALPVAPGTLRRAVTQFFTDGTLPPDSSRAFGETLRVVCFIVRSRIDGYAESHDAPDSLMHLAALLDLMADPASRAAARVALPAAVRDAGVTVPPGLSPEVTT